MTLGDRRNGLSLPAYARLDARIDRTFMWQRRRLTVFVEVANLLNRTNLRNVPYDIDRNGRVSGGTASMLPILPSAGIVIEFCESRPDPVMDQALRFARASMQVGSNARRLLCWHRCV